MQHLYSYRFKSFGNLIHLILQRFQIIFTSSVPFLVGFFLQKFVNRKLLGEPKIFFIMHKFQIIKVLCRLLPSTRQDHCVKSGGNLGFLTGKGQVEGKIRSATFSNATKYSSSTINETTIRVKRTVSSRNIRFPFHKTILDK